MDLKTIIKQLIFVLLVLFIGQNCAANKGCATSKRCGQSCTTESQCKSKRCKAREYRSQKIIAKNNQHPRIFKKANSNPDLSLVAAHSLEIAELRSQIQYLEERLNAYEGPQKNHNYSQGAYSKKIVLNNGTTLLGNIIYQDDYWIQVETTIGTLSLDVNSVVRIIDATASVIDVGLDNTLLEIPVEDYVQEQQNDINIAEVVLLGELFETRDEAYNTMISGEVQNTGMKRADFVKITFTIYKNQNYNTTTKDYTVFVEGSTVAFEHGAVSHSSLYPNETGTFSVLIPSDFGPFISYSYRIDWETYE